MSDIKEWKLGDGNKTFSYIFPMLGLSINEFWNPSFPKANFVEAFIGDDSNGLCDNCILLLYKFSGKLGYMEFEDKLREHPEFQSSYEPDKIHTMYVFTVPERYKKEYQKVIEGRYSQLDEGYKRHIISFHGMKEDHGVIDVLYKKEAAFKKLEQQFGIKIDRSQEASSLFIREREYYQEKYKIKDAFDSSVEFGNIKDKDMNGTLNIGDNN